MKRFFYTQMLILLGACGFPTLSYGQNEGTDEQGAYIGSFLLKPTISLLQSYDDNVYRTANAEQQDHITSVSPDILLQSDWNLHKLEMGAQADIKRFRDNTAENREDFAFYISGQYDLDYETYFTGLLRRERLHEDRSSLEDADGDKPLAYDVTTGSLGFTRALGILKLNLGSSLRNFDYQDSTRNNLVVDNDDRDRQQINLQARLAYSVTDNGEIFTRISYDRKIYDNSSAAFRDSGTFGIRAGAAVELTGKTSGEVYAGVLRQRFDGPFKDVRSPAFGGSVRWAVTDLTMFSASLERSILETSLENSSGLVRDSLDINVLHSLAQNMALDGRFSLNDDTYKENTSGLARDNTTYRYGLGFRYDFMNGLSALLDYDFIQRNFASGGQGYDNNKITASVRYAY